jgi:hypothetical protein
MNTFLIFLSGFIGGFAFLAVIRLYAEKSNIKRNKQLEQEHAEEDAMRIEWRKNNKADFNSATLKVIQLKHPEKSQNTYYNNDEIFITFCLEDMLSVPEGVLLLLNSQNDDLQMKDMAKMVDAELIKPSILENNFYKLLDSGKVTIYSKMEGKFVDKIMRDKWGFSAGPTAGAGGYNYYLPDGTPFFSTTAWVS